jgi:hypothetical protein
MLRQTLRNTRRQSRRRVEILALLPARIAENDIFRLRVHNRHHHFIRRIVVVAGPAQRGKHIFEQGPVVVSRLELSRVVRLVRIRSDGDRYFLFLKSRREVSGKLVVRV